MFFSRISFIYVSEDLIKLTSTAATSAGGDAQNVMAEAHSIMNQINVIFLPHKLINTTNSDSTESGTSADKSGGGCKNSDSVWKTSPYSNPAVHSILFQLKSKGASFVGMRMVWMTRPQATQVVNFISDVDKHEQFVSVLRQCNFVWKQLQRLFLRSDQKLLAKTCNAVFVEKQVRKMRDRNIATQSSIMGVIQLSSIIFSYKYDKYL